MHVVHSEHCAVQYIPAVSVQKADPPPRAIVRLAACVLLAAVVYGTTPWISPSSRRSSNLTSAQVAGCYCANGIRLASRGTVPLVKKSQCNQ